MVVDGKATLQQRNVSYAKLTGGACGDFGFHIIPDLSACEAAAATLEAGNSAILDQPYDEHFDSAAQLDGCCLGNGRQLASKANLSRRKEAGCSELCSTRRYTPSTL